MCSANCQTVCAVLNLDSYQTTASCVSLPSMNRYVVAVLFRNLAKAKKCNKFEKEKHTQKQKKSTSKERGKWVLSRRILVEPLSKILLLF